MSALKRIVAAVVIGSASGLAIALTPALAQGTAQSIMPPGPGGGYGTAQPIGNSGAPVSTGRHNYYVRGPYAAPASTPRATGHRRRAR